MLHKLIFYDYVLPCFIYDQMFNFKHNNNIDISNFNT